MSDPICAVDGKRPTPDGYACWGCANRTDGHLADIIDLAPDARLVAAGLVRRGGGGGSNKPGSRPPLNDGATDALDEVVNLMTTLARDVAETRGLQIVSAASGSRMVPDPLIAAARFLSDQIGWLRHAIEGGEPYAIRAFDEIAVCAGRLRGLVNGPGEQKFLGPCGAELTATAEPCPGECSCASGPRTAISAACAGCFCLTACHPSVATDAEGQICDGDVYAHGGAKVGRCKTCGAVVATSEREAWLDGEVRTWSFRASEIANAHRINVKTIRTWHARGLLVAHGHDGAGTPLFNVGDVLDLAAADAARRATEQAKRARRRERAALDDDGRISA